MIAYNHYIKFIPELKNDKKVEGSFLDTITVQESTHNDLEDKLKYELKFFNNQGRDLTLYTDREFAHTRKGQIWAIEIKDVMTFFWYSGSLNLEYIKDDCFTNELLEYWCLHIVLPIFFTIEDIYDFLHAGAVEINGKPILFLAESFGGKSTMIDFFIKQGHTILSDDKVAIYENDDQIFCVPSHPHYRPYRKMENLGYFLENFSCKVQPIQVIYVLEKTDGKAEIKIKEQKGIKKYKSLHFAGDINFFFQKQKRFDLLSKLTKTTPIYSVGVPWDLSRLKNVYDEIMKHTLDLNKMHDI